MLKLVSGHVHRHSPTGIATKTPSREMEEPLRAFYDMQASPKAEARQGSGSQTYMEGVPPDGSQTFSEGAPQNDWGDSAYTLSPAEKRRKMNRESARRTRQRKQEQTVSLKAEIASLVTQNLCVSQQLKSISDKNQELTAERQKLYEQNHTLMKCVAELSTVCKQKKATVEELRHCLQAADKLTDIPLPPEQGQGQLSSQSIEMLCIPQLSIPNLTQPTSCRPKAKRAQPSHSHGIAKPDCNPHVNMPAATTSQVLTPMQMYDSSSKYIPSRKQPLMTPLHTNSTFSRNPMMQSSAKTAGMASLPRSTSAGSMPWVPTLGSSCHANTSAANCYASNSLRTCHNHLYNAPITSGNPTQQAGNPVQQTRRTQPNPQRCVSGRAGIGMSRCDSGGNACRQQGSSADARQVLMDEAAKQQDGFNPQHISDLVRMTQMPEVQRASSDPSFLRPTSLRKPETVQDILGRTFDWRADSVQQQSLEPSMVSSDVSLEAASTQGPQSTALGCTHQTVNMSTRAFCQVPMQHLVAGEHHNYSMQ